MDLGFFFLTRHCVLGNRNSMVIWSPKFHNMDSYLFKRTFELKSGWWKIQLWGVDFNLSKEPVEGPCSSTCVLHISKPLFIFLLEPLNAVLIQCDYKTEEKNSNNKGFNEVIELVEIRKEGK